MRKYGATSRGKLVAFEADKPVHGALCERFCYFSQSGLAVKNGLAGKPLAFPKFSRSS